YPYFLYFAPAAQLFPWSIFAPCVAIAEALRARCQFEAALKWYERAFNPLDDDCLWIRCVREDDVEGEDRPRRSVCCDSTDVSCDVVRQRSILLAYLDTLLEWADALMRRGAPEAFQQARLILDTAAQIMGPRPRTVKDPAPSGQQTVSTLVPLFPPLNPRLMALYDHVADRRAVVHHCLDSHRLRIAPVSCESPYFGCEPHEATCCCADTEWCDLPSPYRFSFLWEKAQDLAGRVAQLGAELLSAYEKGDAEYLAALHARNDHELAVLQRKIREDQWRDADGQVKALGLTKQASQTSRRYYAGLLAAGLNTNELGYQNYSSVAIGLRVGGVVSDAIAEIMDLIPDLFVGFP